MIRNNAPSAAVNFKQTVDRFDIVNVGQQDLEVKRTVLLFCGCVDLSSWADICNITYDFHSGMLHGTGGIEFENDNLDIGPLQQDLVEKIAGSVSWVQPVDVHWFVGMEQIICLCSPYLSEASSAEGAMSSVRAAVEEILVIEIDDDWCVFTWIIKCMRACTYSS